MNAISLRRAVLLFATLFASVALVLFGGSCDGFFVSQSSVQSVTITNPSFPAGAAPVIFLEAGSTPASSFSVTSQSTTVGNVTTDDTSTATWSTGSSGVATVSAGVVTAASGATAGETTTIKVTDGGQSATVTVLIYAAPTPTTLTVSIQNSSTTTFQLNAAFGGGVTQNNADFAWTSGDNNVATVSNTGLVTMLSGATAGTQAIITATAYVGSVSGTASSPVTGASTCSIDSVTLVASCTEN